MVFSMLREGAGVLGRSEVEGSPLQAALGVRPTSGGTANLSRREHTAKEGTAAAISRNVARYGATKLTWKGPRSKQKTEAKIP